VPPRRKWWKNPAIIVPSGVALFIGILQYAPEHIWPTLFPPILTYTRIVHWGDAKELQRLSGNTLNPPKERTVRSVEAIEKTKGAAAAYGSTVYALPSGCGSQMYGASTYYSCGGVWYQPRYYGSQVNYQAVNAPY
jgi:hypothetical protein